MIRSSRASSGGSPPPRLAAVARRWRIQCATARPEFPFDVARRGYAVGAAVLEAVLPAHDGPTVAAPVNMTDEGLDLRDGVEAKAIVVEQLARALELIGQHDPSTDYDPRRRVFRECCAILRTRKPVWRRSRHRVAPDAQIFDDARPSPLKRDSSAARVSSWPAITTTASTMRRAATTLTIIPKPRRFLLLLSPPAIGKF